MSFKGKRFTSLSALVLITAGVASPVINTVTSSSPVVFAEGTESVLKDKQEKKQSPSTNTEAEKLEYNPGSGKVASPVKEKTIYSEDVETSNQAVINGGNDLKSVDVNAPVYNASVLLQNVGGGSRVSGSGMFVAPNVFVTVAHNFLEDDGTDSKTTGDNMKYYLGSNTERKGAPTSGVGFDYKKENIHYYHKELYKKEKGASIPKKYGVDLAVVVVDTPIQMAVKGYDFNDLVSAPQQMSNGTGVKIIGYPGTKEQTITAPLVVGKLYEQNSHNVVSENLAPKDNFYFVPNTTLAGMSGSGVLNSDNKVMGVHQFGMSDAVGKNGGMIFNQDQLNWIKGIINQNKVEGLKEYNGKHYFFESSGHLAKNTTKVIGKNLWSFDQDGVGTDKGEAKLGSIILELVDESGNPIPGQKKNTVISNQTEGSAYDISPVKIDGYEFVGLAKDSAPLKGNIAAGIKTIKAQYKAIKNSTENKPADKPAENKPATPATPSPTKPVENKPAENKPVENKPAENKPVETKPSTPTKPDENKPATPTKPTESSKPAENTGSTPIKPADKPTPSATDKGDDKKPTGTKTELKPSESDKGDKNTPSETKPGDSKPSESDKDKGKSGSETKPDAKNPESKSGENKAGTNTDGGTKTSGSDAGKTADKKDPIKTGAGAGVLVAPGLALGGGVGLLGLARFVAKRKNKD